MTALDDAPFLLGDLQHALIMRKTPAESIDVGPAVLEAMFAFLDATGRPLVALPRVPGPLLFMGVPVVPRGDMLESVWEIRP